MLVEKQTDLVDKIVSILLHTGQEVIGKVVSEDDKKIVLTKTRTLMSAPDGKGLAIVPILATGDPENINVFRHDQYITIGITNPAYTQAYQQSISSVLTTQKPNLIV